MKATPGGFVGVPVPAVGGDNVALPTGYEGTGRVVLIVESESETAEIGAAVLTGGAETETAGAELTGTGMPRRCAQTEMSSFCTAVSIRRGRMYETGLG